MFARGGVVTFSSVAGIAVIGRALRRSSTLTTHNTLTLPGGPVSNVSSIATPYASNPATQHDCQRLRHHPVVSRVAQQPSAQSLRLGHTGKGALYLGTPYFLCSSRMWCGQSYRVSPALLKRSWRPR